MSKEERRAHERKRVIFGAQASMEGKASRMNCVVRNFSDAGANIELGSDMPLPEDINLTIGSKRRAYKAKIVWSQDKVAGVAFKANSASITPDTDLEDRLRRSEQKARKLRLRVRQLTDGV